MNTFSYLFTYLFTYLFAYLFAYLFGHLAVFRFSFSSLPALTLLAFHSYPALI